MAATRGDWVRAVCEVPADDTRRLAFADWLEESTEPRYAAGAAARADHIRRSVGAAKFGVENGWTLQPHIHHEWKSLFVAVGLGDDQYLYRRGFVDELRLTAAQFLARSRDLFASYPVTVVRLSDCWPWAGTRSGARRGTPDVYGWWCGSHLAPAADVLPESLLDHMADDPRRLPTTQDYRTGNGGHGGVMFARDETARDALSRACVTYGRLAAGLDPLE